MLTTHEDVLSWLAQDEKNVEMFLKRVRKIMKEKIVLVVDKAVAITVYRADKKHSKIRR